jgi:hypothetical protein
MKLAAKRTASEVLAQMLARRCNACDRRLHFLFALIILPT